VLQHPEVYRTCDQAVVGSIPGRAAIKLYLWLSAYSVHVGMINYMLLACVKARVGRAVNFFCVFLCVFISDNVCVTRWRENEGTHSIYEADWLTD